MRIKQMLGGAFYALLAGVLVLALAVLIPVEVDAATYGAPSTSAPDGVVIDPAYDNYSKLIWTLGDGDYLVMYLDYSNSIGITTVTTAAQLLAFSEAVEGEYTSFYSKGYTYDVTIGADIDLTDVAFDSIGNSDDPFVGTFDGGSNTITLGSVPLFGDVGDATDTTATTISNLTLKSSDLSNVALASQTLGTTVTYTNTSIVYTLTEGVGYTFPTDMTGIQDSSGASDGYTYTAGTTFYVATSGDYTFTA